MKRETIVVAIALATATTANAWVQTAAGTITAIGSGWNTDSMWVTTSAPSPTSGCSIPTQYVTDASAAERKAHHAALLLAYAMSKQVVLTVEGCVGPYPRIIGVEIRN